MSAYVLSRKSIALASFATAAAMLTAGCANMVTTASPVNSFSQAGTISGHTHGGNQPVTGATVKLYAAGTTGYGSAATLYATTTSANDAFGSFSFTKSATNIGNTTPTTPVYGCPATGDPQMYIMATGGSTQGTGNGVNTAAAFIAAIGKCSTIGAGTFVDLNEVTSVGTLAALQQYFSPVTDSFGYPNTTQAIQGFANGVSTIANLVNVPTGSVNQGSTLTATPTGATAAVSVTVTPEFAKINTIANITAACVNNTSSTAGNCTTLFANATPPTNTVTSQPTITYPTLTSDVLQATYYMLTNPTSGGGPQINTLFGLAPATAPFQPSLTTAPTDWTIGVRYSSASACTTGTFLLASYALAADATGNIWIAGGGTSTASSNLEALSPNGTPANCSLGASVLSAKGLTIDTGNNVWIASNVANASFYKYSIANSTSTTYATPTGAVPYAVTADGSGNIFFTDATNAAVNEFVAGATMAAVAATKVATVTAYPFFLAADTSGNLLVTSSTTTNVLFLVQPSTATGNTGGYATTTIGTATNVINPYSVAAGLNGQFLVGNSTYSSSTVSQTAYSVTPTGAGTAAFGTNSAQYGGGIGAPRGPGAVDGAGNYWFADSLAAAGNYVTGATTSGLYDVAEFAANGTPLSPSSTLTTGNNAGFQKDSTIINSAPRGLAIDISGNVWGGSNSSTGNGVFEIVGAAVPVVTPIAASLKLSIAAASTNAVSKP